VETILAEQPSSPSLLEAALAYLRLVREGQSAFFSVQEGLHWCTLLRPNLLLLSRGPSRLLTLELMGLFPSLPREEQDQGEGEGGECRIVSTCLEIERLCGGLSLENDSEVVLRLDQLHVLVQAPHTPSVYQPLLLTHMFGLLHVKFASLWPAIQHVAQTLCRSHFPLVSEIIIEQMRTLNESFPPPPPRSVDIETPFSLLCSKEELQEVTDGATYLKLVYTSHNSFAPVLEQKSRAVIELFLRFLSRLY
jgi:hypothetical protein